MWVIPSHVQGFAFSELWEISASSFLQSVKSSQMAALQRIGFSPFSLLLSSKVSSVKLLIGVHAFAQVVNINVKHYWPWYQPLSNTMSNGPPVVLLTSYYYSLCLTIQTVIHSPFTQLIWSICHQCRYKDIMGHLAKIFAKSTSTALFLSSYHSRQSDLSGMICSWQICTG